MLVMMFHQAPEDPFWNYNTSIPQVSLVYSKNVDQSFILANFTSPSRLKMAARWHIMPLSGKFENEHQNWLDRLRDPKYDGTQKFVTI